MANQGFFISMESIDGLGKSTQVASLAESLVRAGHDVFLTKEPGDEKTGSIVGAGIRRILFHDVKTQNMAPGVADLLFLADHIQAEHEVKAALQKDQIVISDRYADSQFAYASSKTKRCPEWALKLYHEHFKVKPDMTVLLVARGKKAFMPDNRGVMWDREDISWALTRAKTRKGAEAGKQDGKAWGNDVEEQRRIQNAYLLQLANQPRLFIVDVWEQATIDQIAKCILAEALRRIEVKHTVSVDPQLLLPISATQPSSMVM
jgi:dTMP kinase